MILLKGRGNRLNDFFKFFKGYDKDLYEQQLLNVSMEGLPEGQGQKPGRPSSQQDILADENFIYIYIYMYIYMYVSKG